MADLLSLNFSELIDELEDIQARLEAWNATQSRCRNLSLAITNLENVLDKMYRVMYDTQRNPS